MKTRLVTAGGNYHGRNVEGKLKTFHKALDNSYQSEIITLDEGLETERKWKCLINPSRLTEQFDKKVISIDFESGLTEGTVFYWDRTEKHWIVNLQQHTEEAYFRGSITRCDYEADINGHKYWVYLRGPVESDIAWSQKHGLYFNDLNYSLLMHITKNKETLDYFSRFNIVKVCFTYEDNGEKIEEWHRWQVAATDKYSNDNIIEVYLDEYADNPIEDEMIPPKEKEFEPDEVHIEGPQVISAWDTNVSYSIVGLTGGEFVVNSNKVKITNSNETSFTMDVLTGKATTIEIIYRREGEADITLPVTITSL